MKAVLKRLESLPDSVLLLLALIPRVAFGQSLSQRLYQMDESGFSGSAWQWAKTGVLGSDGLRQALAPAPAVFFGCFYRWFGPSLRWPRLGQAAVAAYAAWVIGRLAEELSSSKTAGKLAFIIAAVYPFFIYYSAMLMSETLYTAFCATSFWTLTRSLKRPDAWRWAAAAGLALALASLTRVEAAGAAALIWLGCAGLCLAGRWSWRAWTAAVLFWILPLLGWAARNEAALGRFTLDSHGGITLLHGTIAYETDQRFGTAAAVAQLQRMPFFQQAQSLPESKRDEVYQRAAFDFMRQHPLLTLSQWGRKFVGFWRFYPRLDSLYYETAVSRPDVGLRRWTLAAISLLFEPWLIVLGAAGLWRLRREPAALPLILFVAASTGIHMLTVSMMRYRLASMSVLIAATADWLSRKSGSAG